MFDTAHVHTALLLQAVSLCLTCPKAIFQRLRCRYRACLRTLLHICHALHISALHCLQTRLGCHANFACLVSVLIRLLQLFAVDVHSVCVHRIALHHCMSCLIDTCTLTCSVSKQLCKCCDVNYTRHCRMLHCRPDRGQLNLFHSSHQHQAFFFTSTKNPHRLRSF